MLHRKEQRDLNVTQKYIANKWYSHDEYIFVYIMYAIIYIYKQISCVDFISAFLFEGQLCEIFLYFQQCC